LLPSSVLRERLPQLQHDAFVYEPRVGTVDNFRVIVIDDDTRIMATVVYDGDFKPYVDDILRSAGPWLDEIFTDVVDGYPGTADRSAAAAFVLANAYTADITAVPGRCAQIVRHQLQLSAVLDRARRGCRRRHRQ
jgi:hypothetical protein